MTQLRMIRTELLRPDPDTQFDWSFNPKWLKVRMDEGGFDPDKAGVIDVSPANGSAEGMYDVWWGRHRAVLAQQSGVREIRCDVHEGLNTAAKHAIKLAKDRDQRRVRAVETFLNEVGAGQEPATSILRDVRDSGYQVGKRKSDLTIIEAVAQLRTIWREGGSELLSAVLAFNRSIEAWYAAPGTNEAQWLDGLAQAVQDGWTQRLTEAKRDRLEHVVPLRVVKHSQGAAERASRARGADRVVARHISESLRKSAGVRKVTGRDNHE